MMYLLITLALFTIGLHQHPIWVQCEPTNGKVWEPMNRVLNKFNHEADQVELDGSLIRLPEPFDITKLPEPVQVDQRVGEQVRFDHIGVVDMLSNRQPDDPFSTSTKFHLFKGKENRVIKFKLYNNCIKASELVDANSGLKCLKIPFNLSQLNDIFDPKKRTLIIVGGFLSKSPSDWQLRLADKWLRIEDVNVIIVSWNKGNKYLYSKAVSNTKVVARQIVVLLYYLARMHNLDPRDKQFTDNIMLVGHSLGAHIAGFVGQDFGGKLGRITGLDPAGPSFSQSHESHRLDRNDAQFVDVIHTNADFGIQVFLGIYTQVGHVDFYANDGKWQPSCRLSPTFLQCNHSAVVEYYISILDHELSMRYHYDKQSRDKYRIVGYKAKSFNQFRSGRSMLKNCPEMALDSDGETRAQSGGADFTGCGIPIDFVKKPAEIRQELEEIYKINFDPLYKPQEKYWFFTSHKLPFVVEHNLMKLHYELPKAADGFDINQKQCSLRMTYTMLDGEKSVREVPRFRPHLDASQRHPHTTIPFVNHNLDGRYRLIDVDSTDYLESGEKKKGNADEEIIENAYAIFPAKLELDTDPLDQGNNEKSALGKMMRCWFSDGLCSGVDDDAGRKICDYKIKTVRLQPLRKTKRLFMAIYTARARLPEDGNGQSKAKKNASQSTFKPKVIRLKEGEPLPSIGLADGATDPTVYLDTIVIGPADTESETAAGEQQKPSYHSTTPYEEAVIIGTQKPLYSLEYEQDAPDVTRENILADSPYAIDDSHFDFTSFGT